MSDLSDFKRLVHEPERAHAEATMNLLANQAIISEWRRSDLAHWTHRMLQALDIYWLHYDPPPRLDRVRSQANAEDWWHRFENYRHRVERLIRGDV